MAVIETDKLTKYYGKSRGIEDLSLAVEKGEIFGFLGPNGAGKTTTIRTLLGLIFPTSGSARILGHDIVSDSVAVRRLTAYIPGDIHLYPKMTGNEFLRYFTGFRPDRPPVLRDSLVERFDLDLSKRVKDMSRGNKQKLAIVMALMHDPEVLVLDEPTLGLDPLMQRLFYEILREFQARGKTTFLSSHILSDVEKTCERVAIVKDGHLAAIEDVKAVEAKKIRHVRVTFAAEVPKNLFDLPGVVVTQSDGRSFQMKVKGDVDPVLKAMAKHKVVDVIMEHATLEEIFLEFYGEGESE